MSLACADPFAAGLRNSSGCRHTRRLAGAVRAQGGAAGAGAPLRMCPAPPPPPARRPFARAAIARETTGPPEQMESATTPVQRACNSAAVCTPTRRSDEPGAAGAAPEPRVSGRGRHRRRPGHRHAGPRPCRAVCAWANSPPSSADCCPRFAKQPLAFPEFFSVGRARCCFPQPHPTKKAQGTHVLAER